MNFFNALFEQSGLLLVTIPSALVILVSRTWFAAKMAGDKEVRPFTEFSLPSFICLTLTGAAPGGVIRDKPLPLLRFAYAQLWLIILLAVGIIYTLLKAPAPDTYSARFVTVFISESWAMFVLNFIPLPPFDAAAGYFSQYTQWKMFSVLNSTLTFVVLFILSFNFWRLDFFTGGFLLKWLNLA